MDTLIIFGAKYLLPVSALVAVIYVFKQPREKQKQMIILAVIVFPISYIFAKVLGHFYFDPRPFVVGHFTPLIPHVADNGFPSDHTLLGAAIAAAIFHFNRRIGLILFLLAILIGTSRVFAGVHHPADIIGSLAVVLAVYFFTLKFLLPSVWRRFQKTV